MSMKMNERLVEQQNRLDDKLVRQWAPVLESTKSGVPKLRNDQEKRIIARLLENQVRDADASKASARLGTLNESGPTVSTSGVANYDPVLISMVRRAIPQTIAFDVLGVQPMSLPTGLIFALKARYGSGDTKNPEALFNEANSAYSGTGTHKDINELDITDGETLLKSTGTGFEKELGEMLSTGEEGAGKISQMGLTIESVSVTAKTRKLSAQYSIELLQDLRTVHDLDANAEIADILSKEIIVDMNREVLRKMYGVAKIGAQDCAVKGVFNLDVDADGRWSVEKFKGLLFAIEKEANQIALETRRGKGNFLVVSANVASVLAMTGFLDTGSMNKEFTLDVDPSTNTFAGTLAGKYKVYIDPYVTAFNFILVGYKGSSQLDAGAFYCPYIGASFYETRDPNNFQPIVGVQSRYGLVQNPLSTTNVNDASQWTAHQNMYYRIFKVTGLDSLTNDIGTEK